MLALTNIYTMGWANLITLRYTVYQSLPKNDQKQIALFILPHRGASDGTFVNKAATASFGTYVRRENPATDCMGVEDFAMYR